MWDKVWSKEIKLKMQNIYTEDQTKRGSNHEDGCLSKDCQKFTRDIKPMDQEAQIHSKQNKN